MMIDMIFTITDWNIYMYIYDTCLVISFFTCKIISEIDVQEENYIFDNSSICF
jgi:hypothetical protein